MNTPSPKDVPVSEVWGIKPPGDYGGRWIAVRNDRNNCHPWEALRIDRIGGTYLNDDQVHLVHRLTPEVDDDPIAYSIRQSQVDDVSVTQDEYGQWWAENIIVASEGDATESVTAKIAKFPQKRIVRLLAVCQAMSTEQGRVRDRLRAIAPDADESTLATLAADPSIIAALGGGRYA